MAVGDSTSQTSVHLHVHSEYSLLDGACKIERLAERAASFGQPALGLTDHGVMSGAVEHFKACRKHGIKPIIGCEAYFVDDRTFRGPGKVERNHLTLLAATPTGYRNLVKLSSAGFLEGLYRGKPAVDLELLGQHSEGLIALTGCLASRFCQRILQAKDTEARAHLDDLMQVFGPEQVYMEIQNNRIDDQNKANIGIVKFAREIGRPLVGTADVHYLTKNDYDHHTALLCVQTKSTLSAPQMTFETNEFYLKSNAEMTTAFAEWPEAIASTVEIAERCDVELELGKQLIPKFPTPNQEAESDYLRAEVFAGLAGRYGDPVPTEAVERAEMELAVIDRMGFNAYFLIVWDFVKYAKNQGIAVGPGRGSAAGSIVAFALRITDLDPLAHGLLFERFLNPERVSMPDIDIDFSVRGREAVMRYVSEKYGQEAVAQIITFGKMFPRAAIRDAARVLGYDYGTGDKLAKLVPDPIMGRAPAFADCLETGEPLRAEYDNDATAKQIIDVAKGLEGIVRNASIHAAAVVIADRPLTDIAPLQLADAGTDADGNRIYRTVTQYSMKPVEEIGLLKMDFLGLRNLDVIEDSLDIIERSTGERPSMETLPVDDAKTFAMLAKGNSVGVFQFESEGMRDALRQVRPTEFEDLVALVALYRPGAMDQISTYARGKRDPGSITYPDERLRSIIEPTKGVILFQEQAMQIATSIAGFSGAKADDLRKAIGKKNREAMAKLKPEFIQGCKESGTKAEVIEWLWSTNEKSADYSFNKSHAACYALISYRTAWLRANYPAEYMAALISSVMSTKDKVPFFVAQCEEMGIKILPPDVSESDHNFTVVKSDIRFGLEAVKGVGYQAVEAIKAARQRGGAFKSIWDFSERVDSRSINKKALEALIKCGAFGSTGATRKGMLAVLEDAQSAGQRMQQDAQIGQGSIFDLGDSDDASNVAVSFAPSHPPIPADEFEQSELLALEKEAVGIFISAHPLREIRTALQAATSATVSELAGKRDKTKVCVGGIITQTKKIKTKRGGYMMFAALDDLKASVELLIFGQALETNADILKVDEIIIVEGRVDHKDRNNTCVVVQEVRKFQPTESELERAKGLAKQQQAAAEPVALKWDVNNLGAASIRELRDVLQSFPGEAEVRLELQTAAGSRHLRFGADYRVENCPSLRAELNSLQ